MICEPAKWIERQRCFLDFILASLWRRKGRNAALLLVYTLLVFLIASVIFFSEAIRYEAGLLLNESPELIVQQTVAGRHALIPIELIERIDAIRGTRAVSPRLWGYYYHPAARANYTIMVPENFVHGRDAAMVGAGVLRTWKTIQDNQLVFKAADGGTVTLKVVEKFQAETDLATADLILVSEDAFRQICGVPPGWATDLAVRVGNPNESRTIAEKIAAELPGARPILREEILRTYNTLFDWRSGYIIVLLSGAVLAFFIFAWDKATGLSAGERIEIGILKGVGWDTADILMIKFWEGLVISLSSFVVGIALAYAHVFFASASLFEHALKGWAVLYPDFRPAPTVDFYQLAVLLFLTVVPYTMMTIVPSWRVATMDPDTVMRRG